MNRRFPGPYGELVFVFSLGLLAQVELWLDRAWAPAREELALVALAMTAVLLLRLRVPLVTLALAAAGLTVVTAASPVANNDPMTLVIMTLVAIYSVGAHTRGRSLLAGTVLVLGVIGLAVVQDGGSLNVSGFLFFGFLVGGPFLAGLAIRIRRERERLLVRERDERARTAVAEERARIARELHDVVAHAVSVIVVQARGGRRMLAADPEEARAAFDTIEETGHQALTEMRRLLGLLRADDESLALAPQPSLAQLDRLVLQVRDAGLPVEVEVVGEPRELPPGVDVSAYRIVQEALTNALRHAGPARAHVRVRYAEDGVELEITDDGAGGANGSGGGHGLVGIRERVAVYGGELRAGPRAEGGYVLRARLPFDWAGV